MRVLEVHNRYRWTGGEDVAVDADIDLLTRNGHNVVRHVVNNITALDHGIIRTARTLWESAWSARSYRLTREIIAVSRPDVAHVHNTWFTHSPSVVTAIHDAGVPTVMSLHNYRLLCLNGLLQLRDGSSCERCVGHHPWRGILRRCYRGSVTASWAMSRMLVTNRMRGTWASDVDLFLTPSQFSRRKLIEGGIAAERIVAKPNHADDPLRGEAGPVDPQPGLPVVLCAGRLSREKGLTLLLDAWRLIDGAGLGVLRIAGTGPLEQEIRRAAAGLHVQVLGMLERKRLEEELRGAALVVLPSTARETFGRIVVEGFSFGRPAVVSNVGGQAELVQEGETGLLFESGNARELAAKLRRLLEETGVRTRMGVQARGEYLRAYSPAVAHAALMEAYRLAADRHRSCGAALAR